MTILLIFCHPNWILKFLPPMLDTVLCDILQLLNGALNNRLILIDAKMKTTYDNWENFLFFSSLFLSIWHKNHNIGIIRKDIHPNADIFYDDKEDLVTGRLFGTTLPVITSEVSMIAYTFNLWIKINKHTCNYVVDLFS